MRTIKLTRVYPDAEGRLSMAEGQYGRAEDGEWMLRLPGRHTASLRDHGVVEHEDGTITVSPSIVYDEPPLPQIHGFLKRGEWRDC